MADFPTLEERVAALETLNSVVQARVVDLARDVSVSFKDLARYQGNLEQQIDAGFNDIRATMATKEDIENIDAQMITITSHMIAMESRILDAFKQVLEVIKTDKRE